MKRLTSLKAGIPFLAGLLVVGGAATLPASVSVAAYPEKPITLLVGFRAGGRIYTLAQILGEEIQKKLGQPVVVTAKPGGGGAVMAAQLRAAKADGHTLGISVTITWAFNPFYQKKAPYKFDDFAYIATLSEGKPALFTRADAPWKTFKDLIEDAKKRAKPLTFVSLAPSVRTQINYIARREGVKFRVVPARGGSAALPMVLGGHADFAFSGGFHHSYAVAGKVRVLAITDRQRHADLPNVKTLEELGYESFPPGYTLVAGPKGIPAAIKDKIADAFKSAIASAKIANAMKKMNAPPAFKGAAATQQEMEAQAKYFQRLIQEERAAK